MDHHQPLRSDDLSCSRFDGFRRCLKCDLRSNPLSMNCWTWDQICKWCVSRHVEIKWLLDTIWGYDGFQKYSPIINDKHRNSKASKTSKNFQDMWEDFQEVYCPIGLKRSASSRAKKGTLIITCRRVKFTKEFYAITTYFLWPSIYCYQKCKYIRIILWIDQ